MTTTAPYDAVIIGAGMSGLAAGIRLAMFGQRVVILEKHSIPGGLNSYYQRRNVEEGGVRLFDVGLHALTNFIKKGEKGKPFSKLLKQLRLSYDDFRLHPQTHSVIDFPGHQLRFSNDFALLESEVARVFPHALADFRRLVEEVRSFDELSLSSTFSSTRARLAQLVREPLLAEMLLAPTLIYGSAWEDDMDWAQFVVMFKSLYFEGFARPAGGVRTIIKLLVEKYLAQGGELRFRAPVGEILTEDGAAMGVRLESGEVIRAQRVFSSMGLPETVTRVSGEVYPAAQPRVGRLSFMEVILVFDRKLNNLGPTIVFRNESPNYRYRRSEGSFDATSAVVCCPDNYEPESRSGEGTLRVTFMANYEIWRALERAAYEEEKSRVAAAALVLVGQLFPDFQGQLRFTDVFSPTTVERYTWHAQGTVYGSPDKVRDGRTPLKNLYIIGTDQGFLGIVGAMLSGISMANLHGLLQAEGP